MSDARQTQPKPKGTARKPPKPADPLPAGVNALLSPAQICVAMGGISERKFRAMVSAGEFPKPDKRIGDLPRWRSSTFNAWAGSLKEG